MGSANPLPLPAAELLGEGEQQFVSRADCDEGNAQAYKQNCIGCRFRQGLYMGPSTLPVEAGITLVGSLISAANLPQGLCLTPLYLTAPLAFTPFTDLALPLPGLLTPDEEAECILCM